MYVTANAPTNCKAGVREGHTDTTTTKSEPDDAQPTYIELSRSHASKQAEKLRAVACNMIGIRQQTAKWIFEATALPNTVFYCGKGRHRERERTVIVWKRCLFTAPNHKFRSANRQRNPNIIERLTLSYSRE